MLSKPDKNFQRCFVTKAVQTTSLALLAPATMLADFNFLPKSYTELILQI
jgi:hypothetical protein